MWKRKEILVILIIQITEVLGFSLILPFLPFYAENMGASPFVVGLILSLFSLLQFVSAPVMGRLSDMYGRKPLLIASQVSTCVSFVVLGIVNSLRSLTQIAGPMLGGYLLTNFFPESLMLVSILVMGVGGMILIGKRKLT